MGILDRREIQMLAPDKRTQRRQKRRPCRQITGRGPRLDIGGALPGAAHAFIIAFRRCSRQAHRRHRRIGAQPQVGAKHIAIGGLVRQKRRQPPGDADESRPRLNLHSLVAAVVEQADQIDVRRIVQLVRPHLAHRQHEHPRPGGVIPRHRPRQLAPPDLITDQPLHAKRHRQIGEPGQRAGHRRQLPDPAQIGQRHQQRHPPFGPPQRGGQTIGGRFGQRSQHALQGRFRFARQNPGQPRRLCLHQPMKIRAAPRRPVQQRHEFQRQPRQNRRQIGCGDRIMGDRAAGQAGGKAHCQRMRPCPGPVNQLPTDPGKSLARITSATPAWPRSGNPSPNVNIRYIDP